MRIYLQSVSRHGLSEGDSGDLITILTHSLCTMLETELMRITDWSNSELGLDNRLDVAVDPALWSSTFVDDTFGESLAYRVRAGE